MRCFECLLEEEEETVVLFSSEFVTFSVAEKFAFFDDDSDSSEERIIGSKVPDPNVGKFGDDSARKKNKTGQQ